MVEQRMEHHAENTCGVTRFGRIANGRHRMERGVEMA